MDPPPHNHHDPSPAASSAAAASGGNQLLPEKLRLMCSYGGHILPRPHDRSLCYVGGETRMVVVDRRSSLAELHHRLSHSLLNGRHFTIKYQLPSEDLDSLISIATDEDLENMIDEYEQRFSSSSSRIRLFLFPTRPETAASMGALLDDAKSETWFVDVLNSVAANLLPRGLSDSATIDHTVLDQIEDNHHNQNSDSSPDLEAAMHDHLQINNDSAITDENKHELLNNNNNNPETSCDNVNSTTLHQVLLLGLDSQYLPPQPVESNSSFGSSSSTPSMSNLPPIEVRAAEDQQSVGLMEEHLSNQVNMGDPQKIILPPNNPNKPAPVGGNNRVFAADEVIIGSDPVFNSGPNSGPRKPPLPLQPVPRKLMSNVYNLQSPDSKNSNSALNNLPSPDSVASDSSIASAGSLSNQTTYGLDPNQPQITTRSEVKPLQVVSTTTDQNTSSYIQETITSSQIPIVQTPPFDPSLSFLMPTQHNGSNKNSNNVHYIPISSYYQPIYLTPQAQSDPQYGHHHQHYHNQPMYLLHPTIQNQTCYETPQSRPLSPPPPQANALLRTINNDQAKQINEAATGLYAVHPLHQLVQPQYIGGVPKIQVQGQSSNVSGVVANVNYGYEYPNNLLQEQMCYAAPSQLLPSPSQYQQTVTSATAVMFPQASSSQISTSSENNTS